MGREKGRENEADMHVTYVKGAVKLNAPVSGGKSLLRTSITAVEHSKAMSS